MRIEDTFLIQNKLGLHARAATVLAQLAVKFDASITLFQDDKEAAGDSVLETNIFLRPGDEKIKNNLKMNNSTELEVFTKLRNLKDKF